jgi:glycine cleavage system H lipoate-binding protein
MKLKHAPDSREARGFGTVYSKTVSDLFCQWQRAVSTEFESTPKTANSDPYGAWWMIQNQVSNTADYDSLLQ